MNFLKVTTKIVLDKRKLTKDNKYPIKLRVTFERKHRYYGRNKGVNAPSVTEKEFDSIMGSPRGDNRTIRTYMDRKKAEADKVLSEMIRFSWLDFDDKFVGRKKKTSKIKEYLLTRSREFKREEKFSSADIYRNAASSLDAYKKNASFHDIDRSFIQGYKEFMKKAGRSVSTTSIYLRSLKAVFEYAIEDRVASKESNPFAKKGMVIEKAEDAKKAMTKGSTLKLIQFQATGENSDKLQFSVDIWILSFFMGGANIKDIFNLKQKNVFADRIEFERQKTRDRTSKPIKVVIPMMPEMNTVINRWASSSGHLFPIYERGQSEEQRWNAFKNRTRTLNKWMKYACKQIGIRDTTVGSARHTFSTQAKDAGLPQLFISEMMGHSKSTVTQGYMSDSPLDRKKKYMNQLKEYISS